MDYKIVLATEEIVSVINGFNDKYGLPITVVEDILTKALNEVTKVKIATIEQQKQEAEKENDNNGKN